VTWELNYITSLKPQTLLKSPAACLSIFFFPPVNFIHTGIFTTLLLFCSGIKLSFKAREIVILDYYFAIANGVVSKDILMENKLEK